MSTFKRAQKFSKTSKDLDQKIQNLNEEMVKTGMSASKKDVDMSSELFNWRQEFGEAEEIREEVDIIIEEVKEKNKKLASVQHSLVETKLTEANEIFADLYGDQVHGVVETYIGRYASEIKDLREDVIVELQKRPKDLKNLEERLDKLDKGYQILSERVSRASNAAREQQLNEETGVTVNQLKQHYQTMIGKLQENLAMGSGGGGEVNLRYLDDVVGVATNPSAYDGKFLKYDHSLGKFVFETVSGGAGVGTGGIQLTDLSVIVTPAGISSLTYDDLTGIFEFTPPDLVGFTTTGDVLGIVTSGQIAGVVTAGDLVGFTTEGDLVGFTTAGDLVGFTTEGDLVGLATEGSGIVRRIEVQGDGLEQLGFTDLVTLSNTGVTSIAAGTGIAIDRGTGVVTVSTTGIGLTGAVNSISVGAGLTINQPDGDVIIGISQTGDPGGAGLGYSDFSVTNTLPGISSLTYNDTNGNFDYTPPDLSNFLEGGINILDDDGVIGIVTQINFGDNLFVTATVQSGILTVSGPAPGDVIAGIDTLGTSYFNHLDVTGVSTFASGLQVPGGTGVSNRIELGNSQEFALQYNTATNRGLISAATNPIDIQATTIKLLPNVGENGIIVNQNGSVQLYYDNSLKFETTATGIAVTNQIVVGSVGTGVTINGGTGDIFAGNSITAGFFYGDGQFLQNISPEPVVGFDTSGQTFLTNVSISGITTVHGTNEEFATLTSSTGTVNHDCSAGHIFYHTTPSSDFSVNLINLTLSAEHATTISIVINQGATAYMVTSLEIGGSPVSIKWQGNNTPTGTASGIDNVTFSILNDGGTFVVLGQSVSFGGV